MNPPNTIGLRDLVAPLWSRRRSVGPLGLVLLLSFGYFVSAPAWNQNSRLALTRALVEDGTTIIDRYHVTTGDKSFRDGHFYCDKAPGVSWLAAVPYALFHGLRSLTGGETPDVRVHPLDPLEAAAGISPDPEERKPGDRLVYNQAHRLALYLGSLFAVGLVSIAGAAAVYLLALRAAAERHRTAALATMVYALGTPAFTYSTALYGHQICGSLLVIALAMLVLPERGRVSAGLLALAGTCLGLAVCTEYPAALPVLALCGLAAFRHGWRSAAWVALGGLPWAIALAGYHQAAFGSPFETGYDFVYLPEFAEGMRINYGFGRPSPSALLQITFGSYRGLFYVAPVLLLAVWGLFDQLRRGSPLGRSTIAIALGVFAYHLLLNASYYMWDGGAAAGPRHLVPALPFLALGLVAVVDRTPLLFAALSGLSVAQTLLLVAASPESAQFGNPVWEFSIGRVLEREAAPDGGATNLGLLLGLPGIWSLVPLVLLWAWAWPSLLSDADTR